MPFDEGGESGVNLAFGAGRQDKKLHSLRARSFLHDSNLVLGTTRTARIHEQGDHRGLGYQLAQQLEALGDQLEEDVAEARKVAARPGETGDQAGADRVADAHEAKRRCITPTPSNSQFSFP